MKPASDAPVRLAATSLHGQMMQAGVTFGAIPAKPLRELQAEQAVAAEDTGAQANPYYSSPTARFAATRVLFATSCARSAPSARTLSRTAGSSVNSR